MLDLFQIGASTLCDDLGPVINIVKGVLTLIQIGVPIILIIMGSIDLGKAVMSSDEKEIKGATGILVKRAIAAVAVFLVVVIVNLVMGLVGNSNASGADAKSWADCWNAKSK